MRTLFNALVPIINIRRTKRLRRTISISRYSPFKDLDYLLEVWGEDPELVIGSAGGEGEGLGRHEEGGARAPGQRLHAPVLVDLLHPLELYLLTVNQTNNQSIHKSINQLSNQPRRDREKIVSLLLIKILSTRKNKTVLRIRDVHPGTGFFHPGSRVKKI